ncbi:hypothetical protein Kisp02_59660 [Kineosporia sp. NBRC 101731]|nr:hypothetical protein Kisp02_59660 [Kineosporia sp. NBRC 101731]
MPAAWAPVVGRARPARASRAAEASRRAGLKTERVRMGIHSCAALQGKDCVRTQATRPGQGWAAGLE